MATYEFQSTLFRTERDMLDAIAGEWVSAGGANDRETMLEALAELTDEQLAAECVSAWGLDQPASEDAAETWMEKRGIDEADIGLAFGRLRQDFDAHFPAEESEEAEEDQDA